MALYHFQTRRHVINTFKNVFCYLNFYCQCNEESPAQVTATVYIPSQGKLACGRSNGSIVIVPATQSIMLQVLENKLLDANSEFFCCFFCFVFYSFTLGQKRVCVFTTATYPYSLLRTLSFF